jgi:hypothetical protein
MAADPRKFELDELVNRPGTYFNPQTEVLIVVDDSADMDTEIFEMEDYEGTDYVLVSDDAPVDEAQRDAMLEDFQSRYAPGEGVEEERDEPDEDEVALDPVDED